MKKLSSVLATLGMAGTMMLTVGGVSPASAAGCSTYPPGQEFSVTAIPLQKAVKGGTATLVTAYTHRGDAACTNQSVRVYYAHWSKGGTFHHYTNITTNGHGYASIALNVPHNIRFAFVWYFAPNQGVRSATGFLTATR